MLIARSVHPLPGEAERKARLLSLIDGFASRHVVLVGDLIADQLIAGEIDARTRHTVGGSRPPSLVLRHRATEWMPGGAGGAALGVVALGGRATLAGVVGSDAEGRRLLAALPRQVDRAPIVRLAGYPTPVSTHVLAIGDHSVTQRVVRIDREIGWPLAGQIGRSLVKKLGPAIATCDALLLSDFGSGLVTPGLASVLRRKLSNRRRRRKPPLLIDSRHCLLDYRDPAAGSTDDSETLLNTHLDDDPQTLERAGRTLLRRMRTQALLVRRRSRGLALFQPGQRTVHLPFPGCGQIEDTNCASEPVAATFSLALASGASFYEAARLASYAGGLASTERGVTTVTVRDLVDAVEADHDTAPESWSQEGPAQGRIR